MNKSANKIINKYFGDFSEKQGKSCHIKVDEELLKNFLNQMIISDESESEDASATLQRLFSERTEISVIEADTDKGEELDLKPDRKRFPLFSDFELNNEILNGKDDSGPDDQMIPDLLYSVYAPHWDENTTETGGLMKFFKKIVFRSEPVFSFDYRDKLSFLKDKRYYSIVASLSAYSEFASKNQVVTEDDELKVMLRLIAGLKEDKK